MSMQLPGFQVRSWSDALAVLSLLAMGAAGVVWGMKLESRYDRIEDQLAIQRNVDVKMQAVLDAGVLPRTDERLRAHDMRITELENRLDKDEQLITMLRAQHPNAR